MAACLPGGLVIGLVGLVAAAARAGPAAAGPGRAVATIDMPTPLLFGQRVPCFRHTIGRTGETLGGNGQPPLASPLYCLPAAMMIGNPKCGTTDMFIRMARHPQLVPSSQKEPHFWARGHFKGHSELHMHTHFSTWADELSLYGRSSWPQPENLTDDSGLLPFEGSASTFWDHRHAGNKRGRPADHPLNSANATNAEIIRHTYGNWSKRLRFILVVRNPVKRAWSDYLYFLKDKHVPSPERFHKAVEIEIATLTACFVHSAEIDCLLNVRNMDITNKNATHLGALGRIYIGCYAPMLRHWLEYFDHEQFAIIRSEEYFEAPRATLARVFDHVGVDGPSDAAWDTIVNQDLSDEDRRSSSSKHGSKMVMLNTTAVLLSKFYAPFDQQLDDLLHSWPHHRGGK